MSDWPEEMWPIYSTTLIGTLRAEEYFLDGGSNKGGQHCHDVKFLFLTEGCLPI